MQLSKDWSRMEGGGARHEATRLDGGGRWQHKETVGNSTWELTKATQKKMRAKREREKEKVGWRMGEEWKCGIKEECEEGMVEWEEKQWGAEPAKGDWSTLRGLESERNTRCAEKWWWPMAVEIGCTGTKIHMGVLNAVSIALSLPCLMPLPSPSLSD